ncbi:MAG TPA: prolyl oligopeptidase family serine peptidase [Gemmatimonadaceae bacterium]|nr:prolyl oligopeptidase family serine peptidase [Gemmatimonadaceae bacterium]
MRRALLLSALLPAVASGQRPTYPTTPTIAVADTVHGQVVPDPYRWLEDADSPRTRAWIVEQNALTERWLGQVAERERIRGRVGALWNYARYGVPERGGGKRLFWLENPGLQNQSVLYVQDSPDDEPRVLLDPNALAPDGTIALTTFRPSRDGKLVGYGVATAGSDWQEFRVRDVGSGRDRPDTLRRIKFSDIAWTHDSRGFFYARYDAPSGRDAAADTATGVTRAQRVYYHRLGQPQSQDRLIFDSPDHPDWLFDVEVTDDGLYAIITAAAGTDDRDRVYFIDLDRPGRPRVDAPVVTIIGEALASFAFVDNAGPYFYFVTDHGAPHGRIVAIDINSSREASWRTIVPEGQDVLRAAYTAGNLIVAHYLHDARSTLRLFTPVGTAVGEIALPGPGTVTAVSARATDTDFFYGFASYLSPPTVYRYDVRRGRGAVHRAPQLPLDLSRYETRQLFYRSKDGTRVPLFVTARRGIPLDGSNPTLLYAYGGFNSPMTPAYSPATVAWLDLGGVYAVAAVRGGGEYGSEWHEAGMLDRKQNVFDDFIAAAEYLVAQHYTSPAKLAIEGRSNGGLLVGAVMTQRPELFGAALPGVGVMDMLRFHKFTIGWAWTAEYGSPDDSAQFRVLRGYSPLHNLRPGTRYPATLITTADHDDRVVPAHSLKFAAALQRAQEGDAPILLRVETRAGHGAGKPTTKQIDEAADRLTFLVRALGVSSGGPATP